MVRLKRFPLLCAQELPGAFRYNDLFQLLPAGPDDPRPPFAGARRGLTLEIQLEERTSPERETDTWAHDIRERKRYDKLQPKSPEPGWLQAVRNAMRMERPRAIVRELANLFSIITRHSFGTPDTGHAWVLDTETEPPKARYLQLWYPTFGQGPNTFSSDTGPLLSRVPAPEYWSRLPAGAGEHVELPNDIESLLETYFSISEKLRLAFARACELARSSRKVWSTSRSYLHYRK